MSHFVSVRECYDLLINAEEIEIDSIDEVELQGWVYSMCLFFRIREFRRGF